MGTALEVTGSWKRGEFSSTIRESGTRNSGGFRDSQANIARWLTMTVPQEHPIHIFRSGAFKFAALFFLTFFSGATWGAAEAGAPLGANVRLVPAGGAVIATDAVGNHVAIWHVRERVGGAPVESSRIKGQCYSSALKPSGAAFYIDTAPDDDERGFRLNRPTVARTASGEFVVVWTRDDRARLRRYEKSCSPALEGERDVSASVGTQHGGADIAMAADGTFAITWASLDRGIPYIKLRRFNQKSMPRDTSDLVVKSGDSVSHPSIAMDLTGNLVVVWEGYQQGRVSTDIFASLLARDGTGRSLSVPCQVNYRDGGLASDPDVAMDANGDFVVAWSAEIESDEFGRKNIYARRFDAGRRCVATGSGANSDIEVFATDNTDFEYDALYPVVAMELDGDFAVAGAVNFRDDEAFNGTRLRFFSRDTGPTSACENASDPLRLGGCKVTSERSDSSGVPAIAADADGEVFVAAIVDDDFNDVSSFFRRFTGTENVDLALSVPIPRPTKVRDTLTYEPTVTNLHGGGTLPASATINQAIGSATGISINAVLPAGVTFTGFSGKDWTCAKNGKSKVACTYSGVLYPGKQTKPIINVRPTTTGAKSTRFVLAASQFDERSDQPTSNNFFTVVSQVNP